MDRIPDLSVRRALIPLAFALLLGACASTPRSAALEPTMFTSPRSSEHRGSDDLLTAGLGLDGLRSTAPPAFADAANPTPAELRRRAIWTNWRGIADLAPGGGYGDVYGSVAAVPGREFSAYAKVPGASQPHRVLVQLPDAFDASKPCVLVAPSSGSRGVYGAIAVAGAWGLPKGCAVAYTDKGTGTDYYDLDGQSGARVDGTIGALGEADGLAFVPDAPVDASGVAFKHAHSKDNPEADWGRHVRQAAEFALKTLNEQVPRPGGFDFGNTRIVAVGISNGGGAVLRAAGLEGDWLDAAVAAEPSVYAEGRGSRAIYDYTTEAALLMPCALLDVQNLPQPPLTAQLQAMAALRCASLSQAGLIEGADTAAQAAAAHARLRANGWTEEALRAGALSVAFDMWRAVGVAYASAYGRYPLDEHPCGFSYAMVGAGGATHAATAAERAAWWADASGIPPGAGVNIVARPSQDADAAFAGLRCLRGLWDGQGADADRVRKGVAETRAELPRKGLPVLVLHGTDDGLIPQAFTSLPYVAQAQAAGRDVRYWQVRNAQHFDAFLGLPDYGARYVPMLPYVYRALDRVSAYLDGKGRLPADAVIATMPRGAGKALTAENLAMPK